MGSGVFREVLRAISPSDSERRMEKRFALGLVRRISRSVPKGCKVVLTGSIAKGTFLRDSKDVDIFVLFPKTQQKDKLEIIIERIVKKAFPGINYQLSYAEHPYARFHFQGRRIDLVPAYGIKKAEDRVSAVDRSVLHTKFVLRNLCRKQIDDVLLLKAFLKSNSLYGAEIKVKGFSGYLCELLVISCQSFPGLVHAASSWKAPIVIDICESYERSDHPELVKRFGDFIVIDPTDRNRNVAAAVSLENLKVFMRICRAFAKKPMPRFFLDLPVSFKDRALSASRGHMLLTITMPKPEVVDDVLWGQLHKLEGQLNDHLVDFCPKKIISDDSGDLVTIAVILGKSKLPPKKLVAGPPLSMPNHVQSFRKKHKGAKFLIKKKKIYARISVPRLSAEESIREFFVKFGKTGSHLAFDIRKIRVIRGFPAEHSN